jgi:hypothetical protein
MNLATNQKSSNKQRKAWKATKSVILLLLHDPKDPIAYNVLYILLGGGE